MKKFFAPYCALPRQVRFGEAVVQYAAIFLKATSLKSLLPHLAFYRIIQQNKTSPTLIICLKVHTEDSLAQLVSCELSMYSSSRFSKSNLIGSKKIYGVANELTIHEALFKRSERHIFVLCTHIANKKKSHRYDDTFFFFNAKLNDEIFFFNVSKELNENTLQPH